MFKKKNALHVVQVASLASPHLEVEERTWGYSKVWSNASMPFKLISARNVVSQAGVDGRRIRRSEHLFNVDSRRGCQDLFFFVSFFFSLSLSLSLSGVETFLYLSV